MIDTCPNCGSGQWEPWGRGAYHGHVCLECGWEEIESMPPSRGEMIDGCALLFSAAFILVLTILGVFS